DLDGPHARAPQRLRGGGPGFRLPADEVQDGHAHGQAEGDLVQDSRLGAVGDLGGQLDAPVDRPGGEQEQVVAGQAEPLPGHAVEPEVLGDGREDAPLVALELDAQDVDDVEPGEDLVEVVGDLAAQLLEAAGDEGRRPAQDDPGPELGEAPDVR